MAFTRYYVFECYGYSYGTVGSLDVDVNMNVLKEDGTSITNLFAVGQDSEGVANKDGKAYSPWADMLSPGHLCPVRLPVKQVLNWPSKQLIRFLQKLQESFFVLIPFSSIIGTCY